MMKKIFSKKTMPVYIALLAVSFILGCTAIIFTTSYSAAFEEASKTSLGDNATDMVINALSSLLETEETEAEAEKELSKEALALRTKKNVSFLLMITFFILTALFASFTVAAYRYPIYLESDKYRAKLKRLQKQEKKTQNAN